MTLGEKLRQAREARGISISEVAEQTRISALYIKSIEEDDYRTLPGGIFNKGFVKSFAKYVSVDEQEALQDYATLIGSQDNQFDDEPKTYRPQVLTDDNSSSSMLRTIVLAAIILGLMVAGILALVNYLQKNPTDTAVNNANALMNSTANLPAQANVAGTDASTASAPLINDLRVELKTISAPVSITSVSDGKKSYMLLSPNKPVSFSPKENLKISYAKSLASNVQLTINGKPISLPPATVNPKRNVVEFEITKDNLAQIWQDGKISFNETAADANLLR